VGRNGVLLFLAAVGVLVILLLRFPRAQPWKTTLLVAAALLPPAAALVLSMLRPSLDPRYLAVSVPAWALLAAAGLRMLRLEVAAFAIAALLALAGLRLADVVRSTPENWRAGVAEAFAAKEPQDRVVAAPARTITALSFYAGPDRGSLAGGGPTTFVLARARDATTALYEGRHVVSPPAYALRDSVRLSSRLWLQRWERTALPAG
jgi:integrase